jgi:hypothetical protein
MKRAGCVIIGAQTLPAFAMRLISYDRTTCTRSP